MLTYPARVSARIFGCPVVAEPVKEGESLLKAAIGVCVRLTDRHVHHHHLRRSTSSILHHPTPSQYITMIATAVLPRVALRSANTSVRTALPLRRGFATSRVDLANTLVFLEHKKGIFNPATLSALTAAQKLGGDIDALVVGGESEASEVAEKAAK